MTKDAEDKAATVIADLIDAFALKAVTLIEDCGNSSIEALGRTKMADGRYVAWQINVGLEETEPEHTQDPESDDEVALVTQFAAPIPKKLN